MPMSRNAVIMHKNTTYTRVSELGRGSYGCAFKVVDANKKTYCLKEVSLFSQQPDMAHEVRNPWVSECLLLPTGVINK